jgi:hypothetical protein
VSAAPDTPAAVRSRVPWWRWTAEGLVIVAVVPALVVAYGYWNWLRGWADVHLPGDQRSLRAAFAEGDAHVW